MSRAVDMVLSTLSAEFILKRWPNGGAVVFLRSLWTSTLIFILAISIKSRLAPGAGWAFDGAMAASAIRNDLHWFGAIFGGSYAALYARFASQWTYLANLYNQIMSTQAQSPCDGSAERNRVYANWFAAYIEDAESVHLAKKPIYAALIDSLLRKPRVKDAYMASTVNGELRLARLQDEIDRVLAKERNSVESK